MSVTSYVVTALVNNVPTFVCEGSTPDETLELVASACSPTVVTQQDAESILAACHVAGSAYRTFRGRGMPKPTPIGATLCFVEHGESERVARTIYVVAR